MRVCPQCGARFEEAIQFCPNDGSQTYESADNAQAPQDPLLGCVIDGRYRIEQQIGEGGMGVVYLATHTVLQKKLALKVLRGDDSKDPDVVQRFMQEAQAATSIGHQNIVDISDFGRLPDGSVYFVMEYLDGAPLSALMKQSGSLSPEVATHIVRQIASALEAAHARGIVHRDLKPDNVLIIRREGDSNFVKVLDFGVAKVGGEASKLTKTGMVFGTPHYMSPEQAAGHSVDRRTDIYALGVIMYEMFTGQVPFDADTFMGILSKHMFEAPANPSEVKGVALGPLEGVILKALEKNPDNRYQSFAELMADLDVIAGGGTVDTTAPRVSAPGPQPDGFSFSQAEMESVEGQGPPRGILIVLAILSLIVVGGGVGTTVFFLTGDADGQALAQSPGESQHDAGTPAPAVAAPEPVDDDADAKPEPTPSLPAAPAEPAAAQEIATVTIDSDPPNAEVVLDGVMIGNTPVQIPRPESGMERLTLRLAGYQETPIRISPRSADSLTVTLAQAHVRSRSSRRRGRRSSSQQPRDEHPSPRPHRSTSEVVDPWAN